MRFWRNSTPDAAASGAILYASHAAAIGLSAFLLFLVQPMITKMVLPVFGGGAAVWLTAIVFFQLVLFAGYASSNWAITRFGTRRHLYWQVALTAASLFFVPFATRYGAATVAPPLGIFLLLSATVGLPYFTLSTTSPVVQYWLGGGRGGTTNPYILFAVSNAGSLAGLFAYPLLIERALPTGAQAALWAALYALYAALMAGIVWRSPAVGKNADKPDDAPTEAAPGAAKLKWMVWAMIPSAALIVITGYLTWDVVNFPLLWVLPLALYLLSFVICFAFPGVSRPSKGRASITLAAVMALMLLRGNLLKAPFSVKIAAALAALFALAMFFHGGLEREKPHQSRLTSFYMYVSLGGLLGSLLAGVAAPLLFKTHFEFSVVALFAVTLVVASEVPLRPALKTFFHSALILSAGVGWARQEMGWGSGIVEAARGFYGAYRVEDGRGQGGAVFRRMVVGTHIHGVQRIGSNEPLAYYHRETGIGEAMAVLAKNPAPLRVGMVGLGAGVVASYARPGDRYDFFEIDPLVADLARRHFTFIGGCAGAARVITGDGRLNLLKNPDAFYDLIVMDAFSSGSIPAHLLTADFARAALKKLKPGGVILYNISNRHVDLAPVLKGNAVLLGLRCKRHVSPDDDPANKYTAVWAALGPPGGAFDAVTAGPRWETPRGAPEFWTDDRSDVWPLLRFGTK